MAIEKSILKSTKTNLGVPTDLDVFDETIITHINTAIDTVNDLGIGGDNFMVESDEERWVDFLGEDLKAYKSVKTYVYLVVRTLWDPPSTPHHLNSIEEEKKKLEWRLSVRRDERLDGPPATPSTTPEAWWDLTGLDDFPPEAVIGEYGFDSVSGDVWRKT